MTHCWVACGYGDLEIQSIDVALHRELAPCSWTRTVAAFRAGQWRRYRTWEQQRLEVQVCKQESPTWQIPGSLWFQATSPLWVCLAPVWREEAHMRWVKKDIDKIKKLSYLPPLVLNANLISTLYCYPLCCHVSYNNNCSLKNEKHWTPFSVNCALIEVGVDTCSPNLIGFGIEVSWGSCHKTSQVNIAVVPLDAACNNR